jgi:YjbE family integral membrane protein
MDILSMNFLSALFSIVILDLVLAGDNAVVIALASRSLSSELRNKAIYIGTLGAIVIRTIMTLFAVWLLTIPYLQAIGGLVLIPVAYKLLQQEAEGENIKASASFWGAIKTIIVADAVMGIDNVLAIAGAAHGDFLLVIIGLLISVPIVVWGSKGIGRLMARYPILIYVGSGILTWTAGIMVVHDKTIGPHLAILSSGTAVGIPLIITIIVLTLGYFCSKK